MIYKFLVAITLIALFALSVNEAAVMAIDYGTDWFKVALVKPGIPLDIVLNRDSKRKTQSALTIRGEERIYGSDAVNLGARFPLNTYFSVKKVLGRLVDDKIIKDYQSVFPNKIVPDPIRGTVVFQHNETTTFSVEELLAMQFAHAKEQAEATAQEAIKDVVITVPPYYNQFERQAVLDAADLAGLHVLTLINDVTAVGLNYAISRFTSFTEEPQYHVFYDMGAGSTKASLISFKTSNVKDVGRFNKTIINLEVLSVGYDRTLGGQEFDIRLQRYFAEEFDKKFSGKLKSSIFTSERSMTKLYKEANRVKQILSANTDAIASIENLHEDLDFRLPITRSKFEEITDDLRKRVMGPINTALSNGKLTLADIQSCVLVGGGVRVPSIQAELKDKVGEEKIAQNVNGDEAAVFGAAFRGAGLSRQFKVKEIKVKDITPYSIEVDYSSEPKNSEDGTAKSKVYHTVLFNEFTTIGTRKMMSFPRTSDFNFSLNYAKLDDEIARDFGPTNIAISKITGLTDAIKQFNDVGVDRPKVKVTLQLSDSGLVSATEAIVTIEHQSLADKFKSFFQSEESIKDVPLPDETPNSVNASESTPEVNSTQVNDTEPEPTPKPKLTKTETKNLSIEIEYAGIKPLGENEKVISIKRLRAMDASDLQRRVREEARNNLEAFVYRVRDLIENNEVILVSTDNQRAELSSKLSETSDWLYEEGEKAETDEFRLRLTNLKLLEQPIAFRREERDKLPGAIFTIKTAINSTRAFVEEIKTNTTAENRYYTDEELNKLLNIVGKVEEWLNEKLVLQEKTPPHVDPVLTSTDIEKKLNEMEREFLLLVSKKPKKVKASTTTSTTTTATASSDEQITLSTESTSEPTTTISTTSLETKTKETEQPKSKHEEL